MRFIRTHVKNTWYNYKANKAKQSINKAKINKQAISNNSFNCKQAHSGIKMTSHGVLWRTCKAILKPVYRNLTCRGDVTCDVTKPSRVASSCWPIYNHKVTIITSIPIFIQMTLTLSAYFQHICISKVTSIIVHLLSIHSYGNTLKYMSYSLSIAASNLEKDPAGLLISIRYRPELNIDI